MTRRSPEDVTCRICYAVVPVEGWPRHVDTHPGAFCQQPSPLNGLVVCREREGHGGTHRAALGLMAWRDGRMEHEAEAEVLEEVPAASADQRRPADMPIPVEEP